MSERKRPENLVRVLNWDMDWCFHCDGACARCPACNVNDCACGCVDRREDCPKEWWASQTGREWRLAHAMYWRPGRDELVEHIKALEKAQAEDSPALYLVHKPLKILEYADWHGVEVGFHQEGDQWRIWLIKEPDDEPREHVLCREEAERQLDWEKQRANED